MVPLALFSASLPSQGKRALADALLAIKPQGVIDCPVNRYVNGFGRPSFSKQIGQSTTFAGLVNKDSWFTMKALQINSLNSAFLLEDVENWTLLESYKTSLANANAVNVLNDCAERGVKLSSDYIEAAKSEEHYQNVLQVVGRVGVRNLISAKEKQYESDNLLKSLND